MALQPSEEYETSLTTEEALEVPFTEEQLRWLSAREHMLSSHGTNYSRVHIRRYARAALASFLILASGVGVALHANSTSANDSRDAILNSGRVVLVSDCNRDFSSINRIRGLLIAAREGSKRAHANGNMSDQQYRDAQRFYAEQLASQPLPDCREAVTLLTDDPNLRVRVPTPRYPTDSFHLRTGG
jgi:hypothetical protein